ncbi:MAG: hypothetical protein ACMUIL_12465 [bacterium]
MAEDKERALLEEQIEKLNEEIKTLGYELSALLNVDCNLGECMFDPEADDVKEKLREVEEKKRMLALIKERIGECKEDL